MPLNILQDQSLFSNTHLEKVAHSVGTKIYQQRNSSKKWKSIFPRLAIFSVNLINVGQWVVIGGKFDYYEQGKEREQGMGWPDKKMQQANLWLKILPENIVWLTTFLGSKTRLNLSKLN